MLMLGWLKRLRGGGDTPAATTVSAPAPASAAGVASAPLPASAPASAPAARPQPVNIPHDKIAARAYEIWVRKGKPHGQDLQNWTEAEAELRTEFAKAPVSEPLPRKSR
jgi:hypothetical protein